MRITLWNKHEPGILIGSEVDSFEAKQVRFLSPDSDKFPVENEIHEENESFSRKESVLWNGPLKLRGRFSIFTWKVGVGYPFAAQWTVIFESAVRNPPVDFRYSDRSCQFGSDRFDI